MYALSRVVDGTREALAVHVMYWSVARAAS
jgi:hypothetical protein